MEAVQPGTKQSMEEVEVHTDADRLLENFEVFLANLKLISDSMGNCADKAKTILQNYEGISTNVPRTLQPLIENMELVQTQISSMIIDMEKEKKRFAHEETNADGRGAWRQTFRLLLRLVGEAVTQMSRLPFIPPHESTRHYIARRYTQSHVLPVLADITTHLKVFVTIWPTLTLITMDKSTLNEQEAKTLLASFYTHPFWYSFDSNLSRFRNLFDLLKMSILNSYKRSGFFSKNLHRGINGLQAFFTADKALSRQSDDLGKANANIQFVKELWNLAETGLPEKFISWMKPSIKIREYFRVTLTDEMRKKRPEFADLRSVRVLHLYHASSGGVKLPRGWHTHAPYSSNDLEARQLVATTLDDVDRQDKEHEVRRQENRAEMKMQLMAEYEQERAKDFEDTKELRRKSLNLKKLEKKAEKEERRKQKKMEKRKRKQKGKQSEATNAKESEEESGTDSEMVSDAESVEMREENGANGNELFDESASECSTPSAPISRSETPLGHVASDELVKSEIEHLDGKDEEDSKLTLDLSDELFKPMPLEPFMQGNGPESYNLADPAENGTNDLADITDREDPALKNHVDGAERAAAAEKEVKEAEKRDAEMERRVREDVDGEQGRERREREKRGSAQAKASPSPQPKASKQVRNSKEHECPPAMSETRIPGVLPDGHDGVFDVVLHFHGGGFVSGSPSSHESYLRTWANTTNAIVFSVDYSLGPDYKFPIAFHECFFFYEWITSPNNALGLRPRKIILTGDSAGGNLAVAVALKAAEVGIRKPDGLVVAYPALNCTKVATPSRLVFGNDVLVPYYFLEVCLDGYVDTGASQGDHFLSPNLAPDELIAQLPDDLVFMAAGYDPLLDDTVHFLRRLDKLNKSYVFEVYECPHGFWNFDAILLEAERAMYRAGNMIRCMIDPAYAKLWQLAEERAKRTLASAPLQFSIDRALRPYPARTPATFTPYTADEVLYLITHPNQGKTKKPAEPAATKIDQPKNQAKASSSAGESAKKK